MQKAAQSVSQQRKKTLSSFTIEVIDLSAFSCELSELAASFK